MNLRKSPLLPVLFATLAAMQLALGAVADEWMKFPVYHRAQLPNGVTLLLMEKKGAPLINLSLALKSGSLQDPAGKEGLADITNDLLRKGAGKRTADQIADDLDFIGATLGSSAGYEMTRVRIEFLKKDLAAGLEIFSDLVLDPKFPADEVTKIVQQRVDQIKAEKDNPNQVIGLYYREFLFGAHPYARPVAGDEKSVSTITRDDVVRFHRDTYVSSNVVLIACGDFETADMEKRLAARFGSLPAKTVARMTAAKAPAAEGKRLQLIDKPDATQTFFRIGNVGIALNDPDRPVINLVNTLFGGRFTSRLNTALRIDSGLSYGARSAFTPNREPGDFNIASYTKTATAKEALDTALKVLAALHEKGLTEAELASGKAYLKGQFGPTLETPDQLAERMAQFEVFGLDPKQEVDNYAARLDAVTLEDVRRVIHRAYPQTNLVFTIIGKASEIAPLMKDYAPEIKTTSISEPGFGSSISTK